MVNTLNKFSHSITNLLAGFSSEYIELDSNVEGWGEFVGRLSNGFGLAALTGWWLIIPHPFFPILWLPPYDASAWNYGYENNVTPKKVKTSITYKSVEFNHNGDNIESFLQNLADRKYEHVRELIDVKSIYQANHYLFLTMYSQVGRIFPKLTWGRFKFRLYRLNHQEISHQFYCLILETFVHSSSIVLHNSFHHVNYSVLKVRNTLTRKVQVTSLRYLKQFCDYPYECYIIEILTSLRHFQELFVPFFLNGLLETHDPTGRKTEFDSEDKH